MRKNVHAFNGIERSESNVDCKTLQQNTVDRGDVSQSLIKLNGYRVFICLDLSVFVDTQGANT